MLPASFWNRVFICPIAILFPSRTRHRPRFRRCSKSWPAGSGRWDRRLASLRLLGNRGPGNDPLQGGARRALIGEAILLHRKGLAALRHYPKDLRKEIA